MYEDEDLLPLSALQHLAFCPRQCALIHLESAWTENRLTAEGRLLHDRVHAQGKASRGDVRLAYGLFIRSMELGLIGKADLVEFHRVAATTKTAQQCASTGGVPIPGVAGRWQPMPVEYKRGRPKRDHCDEVQLCAQAFCLEEMLAVSIPDAALYYGKEHRRCGVVLDESLRAEALRVIQRLHELTRRGRTPPPVYRREKCERCSLLDLCLPRAARERHSAQQYLATEIAALEHKSP